MLKMPRNPSGQIYKYIKDLFMENFKKFMVRNRHLAALTVGVSVILIVFFSTLAIVLLDTPKPKDNSDNYTNIKSEERTTTSQRESSDFNSATTNPESIIDASTEATTEVRETLPSDQLPYLIMVNRAMNCVTVYTKDSTEQFTVPVKAMTCSVGREGHDTPLGTYVTSDQFIWAVMADYTRAQYVYRFKGPYLFHSVPYLSTSKDSLETEEFNKLGNPASLGCVRLSAIDAKWIYENCYVNTTVILYDDESSPGPLGKPDTIKIPLDSPYKGWDPTDPDPANPWHNFTARIAAREKTIKVTKGSSLETLLTKYKITDTCGNEIPEKATIEGNYNLNIVGNYTITIKVTDAIGKSASLETTFSVVEEQITEPTTTEKPTTAAPTTAAPTTTKSTTTTAPTISETTTEDLSTTTTEGSNTTVESQVD